jgi:tetratricopeptide (TPR) repeat protein
MLLALGAERAGDALHSFKRALELKPDDTQALADMSIAFRLLGDLDGEFKALASQLKLQTDNAEVWLRLGAVEFKRGRTRKALVCFEKVLQLDADSVSALLQKALVLANLEEWKDAISSAKAATKLEEENVDTWRILGDVYLKAGKHRSAMKSFEKAAKIDPEDAYIPIAMGMTAFESDNLKDAARYFRKALVREPKNKTALVNLGMVYMNLEDWQNARNTWEQVITLIRNNPDIFDAYAVSLVRLDDFCEAQDAWEKARKLYKKKRDSSNAKRVTELGKAARINCSRMKKALREQKELERQQRRHRGR